MASVTFDNLRLFCDLARLGSVSQAAKSMGVTQSAASQTLLQLEKRLGVKLVDRSTRPLQLTPEGRIYLEECRELVDRYDSLESRLRSHRLEFENRVRAASIYSVILLDISRYVRQFQRYRPEGIVRFRYLHPDEVYESVLSEEAELGLVSFPRKMRELDVIPWFDEPMAVVCHPKHRFCQQSTIALSDLTGEDFVAFDESLEIGQRIEKYLRDRDVSVNVTLSFDNLEFIKRAVETSMGVSILPISAVQKEKGLGLLRVVQVGDMDLARSLGIILRRRETRSPAVQTFIEVLCQEGGAKREGWMAEGEERSGGYP